MDLYLRDKRVLITGASKGIGRAIAEAFAEEGASIHLAARDIEALQALARQLHSNYGVSVKTHAVDLRKSEDQQRLFRETSEVEVLVNNAGDIPGGTIETIDEETWRRAWDLKVFGYINLTRLAFSQMRQRQSGVIVNIIGAGAERLDFEYIAGGTGNAALVAFTRSIGARSLHHGVRVVGISPGPVDTQRRLKVLKEHAAVRFGDPLRYAELAISLPMGRAAKPREIADAAVFLASERSAYTSGTVITIDGGFALNR